MVVACSFLVLSCSLLLAISSVWAQSGPEFVIVVNAANASSSLPRARVDGMFLGKITTWSDGSEVALALNSDAGLCESFAQAIHSRSFAAVSAYWAAKTFRDFVVPPSKLDDAAVIKFVKENKGGIGFVTKGTSLSGVKVLSVTD